MGADLGQSPPAKHRSSEPTNSEKSKEYPQEKFFRKRDSSPEPITNFFKTITNRQIIERIDRNNVDYYTKILNLFTFRNTKLYAVTISPKGSAITYSKDVIHQSKALRNIFRSLEEKYKIKYMMFIELYKDLENVHLHGFIQIDTVKQVAQVKQFLFEHIKLRKRQTKETYKPLLDFDQQGIDNLSVERWTKYILKEQQTNIVEFPPIHNLSEFIA